MQSFTMQFSVVFVLPFSSATGLILTSPRAVQAVEAALSSSSTASSMTEILRLPIFIVGGATQKLTQERLSPFVTSASHPVSSSLSSTSSSSSSFTSGPEYPASSAPSLQLFGADTGNAKNLAEFIITHFQEDMNDGRGDFLCKHHPIGSFSFFFLFLSATELTPSGL